MSSQPAMSLSPTMLSARPPAGSRQAAQLGGVSINGYMLFATSTLVVASGFTSFRPEVMGLALHPFLVPMALAFPFVLMSRMGEFPVRVMAALLVFTAMYCFSVFNGRSVSPGEIFKIGSSVVTIVTVTLLVRRRGDFVAGALGLSIAIALLAWNGLQEPSKLVGVEAIQGANKNSYSLFALPAILLAGFIALRMPTVPVAVKSLLVACAFPALLAIFMSGNRSGYLGCVLVGLMLFWDRRGKGLLLVLALTAAVAMVLVQSGRTEVLDERLKHTVSGNESDVYRRDILIACFWIGAENPIIGVSPGQIGWEIGRRTGIVHHYNNVDSHNVFGHVWASSGVICFTAMLACGVVLWTMKPRKGGPLGGKDDPFRVARQLLRMFVVLWVVRGMFTREILYNPSFCIGLGLCIGLCMLAENERSNAREKSSGLPSENSAALRTA